MNKEKLLRQEVELMSHGNISSANLSTCEVYGLSGNCSSRCPKFKDKSCEVYDEVLEKENTNYKQALIDIREYINTTDTFVSNNGEIMQLKDEISGQDILQIIAKVLGDSDENSKN